MRAWFPVRNPAFPESWLVVRPGKQSPNTPGSHRASDDILFNFPNVRSGTAFAQNQGCEPNTALRQGEWKLICLFHHKRWKLHHLPTDIHEDHNLATTTYEVPTGAATSKFYRVGVE
jgi:hypothetical protein